MKPIVILLIAILTACSDSSEQVNSLNQPVAEILTAMPDVNDKNCGDDTYKSIADQNLRQQFIRECKFRGRFKKSETLNMKFN